MIKELEYRMDDLRYNQERIIKYIYTLTPNAVEHIKPKFTRAWRPLKYD